MSDTVIKVENLGKRYTITHEQQLPSDSEPEYRGLPLGRDKFGETDVYQKVNAPTVQCL
jgi:hypothetical protein